MKLAPFDDFRLGVIKGDRIAELNSEMSKITTLEPGDVIATGVIHQHIGAVQNGYVLRAEIEGPGPPLIISVSDPSVCEWPRGVDSEFAAVIIASGRRGQQRFSRPSLVTAQGRVPYPPLALESSIFSTRSQVFVVYFAPIYGAGVYLPIYRVMAPDARNSSPGGQAGELRKEAGVAQRPVSVPHPPDERDFDRDILNCSNSSPSIWALTATFHSGFPERDLRNSSWLLMVVMAFPHHKATLIFHTTPAGMYIYDCHNVYGNSSYALFSGDARRPSLG